MLSSHITVGSERSIPEFLRWVTDSVLTYCFNIEQILCGRGFWFRRNALSAAIETGVAVIIRNAIQFLNLYWRRVNPTS